MMRLLIAALTFATLASCEDRSHQESEAPNDVQYYLDHPQDRAATLEACRNDPGDLGRAPDCENASAAEREARTQERLDALDTD